jgi:putative ABC transport system permease protein
MGFFKQAFTVITIGLYTIPQRLSSAGVAIIGIAGVVVVFVGVLSISEGFEKAMLGAGRPDRAIVMRQGADSEMSSGIGGPEVDLIKQATGIQKNGTVSVASAEMFVVVDVNRRSTNTGSNVPLRGVDSTVLAVRPEVEDRRRTHAELRHQRDRGWPCRKRAVFGLRVGDTFRSGTTQWPVVGVFETNGQRLKPKSGATSARCREHSGEGTLISPCSRSSSHRRRSTPSRTGSRPIPR